MLAISLTATLSANVFINAIAFLIPAMNAQRGTGLAKAGLLASMPNFGTMVTLIGWAICWMSSANDSFSQSVWL